jgi:hypothetical protein
MAKNRGMGVQRLVHPTAINSGATGTSPVQAGNFAIITTRPARPRKIELEYFSSAPRSFVFTVQLGDGEEVYRSRALLSGPIPRRFTASMPTSSDFSIYAQNAPLVTFLHATNPSISFVINLTVEYKSPTILNNF